MEERYAAQAQPAANSLNSDDWRDLTAASVSDQPDRERQGCAPLKTERLHLRSRPAGLAKERERAREILSTARGVVTSAFTDIRFGRKINSADLEPVVAAIAASVSRSPTALPGVTRMKERHEYTYLHSIAVCGLMIALGRELRLDPALTREIGLAGLLHDVGKARVPVALLDKPGPLDFEEYALVQEHTVRGHELLRESGIDSEIALDVCLHHHERIDGSGYPSGISAQSLSIYARMAAVCDVYDAVTSSRSYKESWSPGAALDWMTGTTGHFDPRVLRAFRSMLGVFPLGSLVRLTSQRLAVVLDEPDDDPTSPNVCVFLSAETCEELPLAAVSTRTDPIIGLEVSAHWGLRDWERRREEIVRAFEIAPGN
ncbi:MAG: HD-GYP domain-containing protein [Sphingomonas sp.]|uniref:HD-GYP domain-containing protein n=1 Tax=Sphingomonas sp. TaxID=28214 RepID=UPI001B146607|nr:HD-GYP domain-containing protein [Sphingomonas sp.]MBO9622142.1 HD-GYP domain-containing protein [Sphingomonas sp.]